MKLAFAFFVFFWIICGFFGAWRSEGLDDLHWKTIARGPISLVEALNDNPVSVPSMG